MASENYFTILGRYGLAALLINTIAMASAFAEIYRWKDAAGVVQFSQFKPKANVIEAASVSMGIKHSSTAEIYALNTTNHSFVSTVKESIGSVNKHANYTNQTKKTKSSFEKVKRAEERCTSAKKRLRNIESKMRKGYSAGSESSLRKKKKEATTQYTQLCIKR